MGPTSGPVVPRRRLAAELRRLREGSNLKLDDVAAELLISTSKLSRLENAQGSPKARDVRDLIRLYGIEGTELANRLMRWVSAARQQGWWSDYAEAIQGGPEGHPFDAHLAFEAEASVARVYTIPALPVLLQTADYAREWYRAAEPWRTEAELEALVEVRRRRQRALTAREGRPPLQLVAVTHEASLRQWVGSADIMRTQLEALIESSRAPNVMLRILPFTAPPAFTITCMYAVFEFADEAERDVVNIETHAGFTYLETPKQVERYREHYDEIVRRSLDADRSRSLIRAVSNEYRRAAGGEHRFRPRARG